MFGLDGSAQAIVGGGITGMLGAVLTSVTEYFKQKLLLEHERKIIELENETIKLEAESAVRVVDKEVSSEMANPLPGMNLFNEESRKSTAFIVVDFVRAIIRPAITLWLAVLVYLMYLKINDLILIYGIDTESLSTIYREIYTMILYVFVTCVLWWFGTRVKLFEKKGA